MRYHATQNPSKNVARLVGPGLVTGASDDDPSGIATYSQVGAQFGFSMLWMVFLCYPLMTTIQQICARLGRVTGRGVSANIRKHYSRSLLIIIVGLVVMANVVNIAADISALGAAVLLIVPGDGFVYSALLTIISIALQIFVPYHRYVTVLKWLTVSLLSYVATIFIIEVPWRQVILETIWPHITWSEDYITGMVAVLGTTISPYLFFWQASEEVEEEETSPSEHPLRIAPEEAEFQLRRIRIDTHIGMASATLVFYCIVLTVAVTLHASGITKIETATEAAQALRPLAGDAATLLFALGIIGTGLLAIPVLAGSAAYAISEAFDFPIGLEKRPGEAKAFYGFITLFTFLGLLLNFIKMNPISALYWSAVLNGIVAGPIMIAVMLVAQDPEIMHRFAIRGPVKWIGWLATSVMIIASAQFFYSLI